MSSILSFAAEKMRASQKRRLLARKVEWAAQLEDQISSGQVALDRALREIQQLQAELHLLDDADTLLRRMGAI